MNDAIEKSLKKGRGSEQAAAAQLAALLCLQLGSTNVIDEICQSLIPSLYLIVSDNSMSYLSRAKVCISDVTKALKGSAVEIWEE